MKTKVVIFDFDDTLVKTHEVKWAHHKAVAKRFYDIDLTDKTLRKHWGEPFDVLVTHLYENKDTVERMSKANRSCEDEFLKTPQDGAVSVVQDLQSKGILVGIITSTNRSFLEKDLTRLGFSIDTFFHLQGAEDTPVHKPDPAVFDLLLDMLWLKGINKDQVIYVGDACIDALAAKNAGITFVGVTTGLDSVDDLERCGASHIINNLRDLNTIVSQL